MLDWCELCDRLWNLHDGLAELHNGVRGPFFNIRQCNQCPAQLVQFNLLLLLSNLAEFNFLPLLFFTQRAGRLLRDPPRHHLAKVVARFIARHRWRFLPPLLDR
jgi:hypothetical protein